MEKNKIIFLFLLTFAVVFPLPVFATSGACSDHGGVNCNIKDGLTGNAICNDGWESSVLYYEMDECMQSTSTSYCISPSSYGYRYTSEAQCQGLRVQQAANGTSRYAPEMAAGAIYDCEGQVAQYQAAQIAYQSCLNASRSSYNPDIFCPSNSSQIGTTCACNAGYVAHNSICISYAENCQFKYGYNSYGDRQYCYCSTGYEFNSDKTACIKSVICPSNSKKINNQCNCNEGYMMQNNTCITYNQNCQNQYGQNSYGDKDYCYCSTGYKFNADKTACIESIVCPINATKVNNVCVCNTGYVWDAQHTGCEIVKTTSNINNSINNSEAQKDLSCKDGYVLSFKKDRCIKVPDNATAVSSSTDLWLCNDGYKEVNNACFVVPLEQKNASNQESSQPPMPENKTPKSKNLIRNVWQGVSGFFVKIFNRIFK